MRTITLTVSVSESRVAELQTALAGIEPTTQNPLPGERVLVLGLQAIKRQHARRMYQRTWHRKRKGVRSD